MCEFGACLPARWLRTRHLFVYSTLIPFWLPLVLIALLLDGCPADAAAGGSASADAAAGGR